MTKLIPILRKDEIDKKVATIADQISFDYSDKKLVLIGVLKGAFVFLADIMRHIKIPVLIDFIRVSSYGSNSVSSGNIRLSYEPEVDLKGKAVIIIEDIIDTGLTMSYLVDYIHSFAPDSVDICVLIDKQERRKKNVVIKYTCHVATEGFLVGYGLDYAERYRNLTDICNLKF
jgi:hypoxanthine phosphoribosyltransferase